MEATNQTTIELKPTELQAYVAEHGVSQHTEECKLIKSMLSFHHSSRPSCETIKYYVRTVCKENALSCSDTMYESDDQNTFIPEPVTGYGGYIIANLTLFELLRKYYTSSGFPFY